MLIFLLGGPLLSGPSSYVGRGSLVGVMIVSIMLIVLMSLMSPFWLLLEFLSCTRTPLSA